MTLSAFAFALASADEPSSVAENRYDFSDLAGKFSWEEESTSISKEQISNKGIYPLGRPTLKASDPSQSWIIEY
jgi:hypothetical protein